MSMVKRPWTDAEIAIIREMAGSVTSFQIAEQLGRTNTQVKYAAASRGISLKLYGERAPGAKYSNALVEQARDLHDAGVKPKRIAEMIGMPYWAVCDAVYYKRGIGYAIEH